MKIRNPSFLLISDKNGRLNISLWFCKASRSLRFNPLRRFLKSKQVKVIWMKNKICEKQNLKAHEVIQNTEEGVFVNPEIARLAASYLSDEIFYDIHNRPDEIEKQTKERVKWDSFNLPFAYYLIKIENLVKAEIVRNKEEPTKENLDRRLSTHRSTYARFELINVFEFRNSKTVRLFEETSKHTLALYNIGIDKNIKLEQYECPGKDTGQVINDLVSQQFTLMNIESRQLGMECPKEKIDSYNKIAFKRVGLIVKDDFKGIN